MMNEDRGRPFPSREEGGGEDDARAKELEESLHAIPPRYEPNPILKWLYRRFFDAIAIDSTWAQTVRAAATRGTVVYALRNLSLLDFLALDHLTKRFGLPQVRFANNLGLWVLEPFGKGWSRALRPRTRDDDIADLRAAVMGGQSAALFLKRPPTILERPGLGRGLLEGDDFIRELIALQQRRDQVGDPRPIILLPQLFVWTRQPDQRQRSLVDALIGSREWPSAIRTAGQFLLNYRDVRVKAGEPLDLREFLARQSDRLPEPREPTKASAPGFAAGDPRGDTLVRRTIYVLLRRLERERRVVVGPVVKPSDRLVDEIVRTPRVRKVIEELAGEGKPEKLIVEARARAMLREISAALEPDVIRAMGVAMTQVFRRIYEGLEIDEEGVERLKEASRKGTLVLLPSHKSHIDYLLVSLVMFNHGMQVPLIAAGDNLAFFPLGSLFRRCGAFFIRRKIAGDRLYSAVLDAYMHKIVREGYSIEFFLEGGRSRTGKVLPPKLGLLSMVVDAAYELPTRPIFFVPISIGYERVVEAKSYVRELAGGEKEGESVAGLLRATQVLAERYGRLNLQIGEILTIDRIKSDVVASGGSSFVPKRAIVARLGHQIVYEINRATAVTGGSLVAMALLSHVGRGISRRALERRCDLLLDTLVRVNARLQPTIRQPQGGVAPRTLDDALSLFASAGWIEVHEDEPLSERDRKRGRVRAFSRRADVEEHDDTREPVYLLADEKRLSLDLSKNVIVHFFVNYGLIATALLALKNEASSAEVPMRVLHDRVQYLSRLFKYEFMFRADASFDEILQETLRSLTQEGTLRLEDDRVTLGEGDTPRMRIELYAATIASFLEGYRVTARALRTLTKGSATQKELVKRALSRGKRMFLSGEIARREGISRSIVENAIAAFLDQGYLGRSEGKLVLAPSFATIEAVSAIERRIAMYLAPPGAL